jgi:ATP synthase protein I
MPDSNQQDEQKRIVSEVGLREERMLKARQTKMRSVWQGFGFFGLIGWSVVVPTLIGAGIGRWLDRTWPGDRSWTLIFLIGGLTLGCFNAAHWVLKEQREIKKEHEKKP